MLDPHRERELREARRLANLEREESQLKRKEEKARIAKERAVLREAKGKERAVRLKALLSELQAMGIHERLSRLATDGTIPLEAIPENMITLSLAIVHELPQRIRAALLARLDRRKARRWRKFRKALKP